MFLIHDLSKSFYNKGIEYKLFDSLNLEIKEGDFVSIVGNNGIGKTTLLNIIAGIENFDHGKILINGKRPNKAKIGYVFQNYRQTLLPWMNVIDNIALPLKIKGKGKHERYQLVKDFCSDHHIDFNYEEYPYKLSGGWQQQIVIVRSLIDNPDIVLMDEPFSSLDHHTSLRFQRHMLELWQSLKKTIIFVSHRIDEAIYLSQRILILGNYPTKIIDDFENPLHYPRQISDLSTGKCNLVRRRIFSKLE